MGFIKGAPAAEQPESAAVAVMMCIAVLPITLYVIKLILVYFYDLDEQKLKTTRPAGETSVIGFILRTLITAAGLWLADFLFSGIRIDSVGTLAIAALLMGIVNALVRPLVVFFHATPHDTHSRLVPDGY